MTSPAIESLADSQQRLHPSAQAILEQVQKVFMGPGDIPLAIIIALLARGHVLLEGVPGVAKTTLAKTFAKVLGCGFKRIQFTPDLLPSDITGTYVLDPSNNSFKLRQGPIFTQIVLADEINRAPAKTQSALLEAMQEEQVTVEGVTCALPQPFMTLATQNPVEQTGTYPLPEAELDRFMMRVKIDYPSEQQEREMILRHTSSVPATSTVLDAQQILALQSHVDQIHIATDLVDYVIRIAQYTRRHDYLALGASPRASLTLIQACKARALVYNRDFVLPDDIKALAEQVMAHRLQLNPEGEISGASGEAIVRTAVSSTPIHET